MGMLLRPGGDDIEMGRMLIDTEDHVGVTAQGRAGELMEIDDECMTSCRCGLGKGGRHRGATMLASKALEAGATKRAIVADICRAAGGGDSARVESEAEGSITRVAMGNV